MLVSTQGYVPEPYFLTETLRSQKRFHDPLQDSLFSNAASVDGYRNWSTTSGRSSPVDASSKVTPTSPPHQPTLPVRSSRPIGSPRGLAPAESDVLTQGPQPTSKRVAENVYEADLATLVTPRSMIPGQSGSKRIRYAILEWNPLLDSSNIEISGNRACS